MQDKNSDVGVGNHKIETEYEAMFANVDVDSFKQKLQSIGAQLVKPLFSQRRVVFNFPKGHEIEGGYIRVRDEADKITMSLKIMHGTGLIDSQKEIDLVISNYDKAISLLKLLGATPKAEQETKREIWNIDGVEIMIDLWPFLEPIVEIEGTNELEVKKVAELLGFDWENAIFHSIDYVYNQKYNVSLDRINNQTPKILFDMKNPFLD